MKLKEFRESDLNYLFNGNCKLVIVNENTSVTEIVVDEKTEDSEIDKYNDYTIDEIRPTFYKETVRNDYDNIQFTGAIEYELGFAIVLIKDSVDPKIEVGA